MKNLSNILGALLLSITIISCGGETENSKETQESKDSTIDFSAMKTSIAGILSDYTVEEDGVFHNATIDNKSVHLSVELADNETAIQELVNNLQENPSSIKRTKNGELSANKNTNGSTYKFTTEVNLIVGENVHPSTLYYNIDLNSFIGLLSINLDGTTIHMYFKGRKEKVRK